jgi:excisionase family DNA binding protein
MNPGEDEQLSLELFPEVDVAAARPQLEPTSAEPARVQVPPAVATVDVAGHVPDGAALLTTREAAQLLHVHPRTVQRLVERGQLAAIHLGSAVRFDPFELGGLVGRLKHRRENPEAQVADSLRARTGARVSFADRLRSQQHEHRAAQA